MRRYRFDFLTHFGPTLIALIALTGCPPQYPKCETDEQCAEKGEVCVEGTCQQCRDDAQCEATEQCKGGRCEAKPECATNSDCSGNQICRSGKCQLECSANADCGSGLKCMNNRCVDPLACNTTSDCSAGMNCINGRCTAPTNAGIETCNYPTVRFEFNQAQLSAEVKQGLADVAACMKERGGTLLVEGHCDERGTEEYNLALGDRRARAVAGYLRSLGVPSSRMNIISKGETDPLNSGHDEAAWAENRRAAFIAR